MRKFILVAIILTIYSYGFSQEKIADWNFNKMENNSILDIANDKTDKVHGFFDYKKARDGMAVQFDGYTSYIEREQFGMNLPKSFTINVWFALGAYPWFRCPVFDLRSGEKEGILFAINREGKVCAGIGQPYNWIEIKGPLVPLKSWNMITLRVEQGVKSSIFINGEMVIENYDTPSLRNTSRNRFSIGKNAIMEDWWDYQYIVEDHYSYMDGMIDDIKVYSEILSETRIKDMHTEALPLVSPDFPDRVLPAGPDENPDFGADYTHLKYTNQWDRLWRVSDKPDVLLRFDKNNYRLVFWRGTSFVPCWVTENGIWYTNEWAETWGSDVSSCAEPIMDRDCRFTHVRIIENTPARTVIHWRYGLVDADYKFAALDIDSRGEWADEYYTIYPDGIGIREIQIHYSKPERNHDWEESIILLSPGQHPDDVMMDPEVSLANMLGEQHDYSWRNNLPIEMKLPKNANIHMVNLKSKYKPFYIVSPEPFESVEGKYESPFFRTYSASLSTNYRPDTVPSIYGWWNHWPVAQVPGDGRWVVTNDRASHFNLTTFTQWKNYSKNDRTKTRIMLHGMTDKKASDLVPLANSWLNSPKIVLSDNTILTYDQAERAYIVSDYPKNGLSASINASKEYPAVRPAIILNNKKLAEPRVLINGKTSITDRDYRFGTVKTIDGWKTIIWIDKIFTKETKLSIK